MFEVYASIAVFFVASVAVVRTGLYLPAFFFLCYMLPFLPVIPAIFYDTAHFWTGDAFSFDIDSQDVSAISDVWLASSLGCVLGFLLSRVSVFLPSIARRRQKFPHYDSVIKKMYRLWIVCVLTALFIVLRLIFEGNAGGDVIFGGEMIISVFILFVLLAAKRNKNTSLFVISVFLACLYLFSQILFGDRDFFTIIVALILLFSANQLSGYLGMLKVVALGLLIVGFGALISMLRMSVDVSVVEFIAYFYYNSWTATIQPVLLMLQSEWNTGPTLFGKSYVDLMASVVPSAVYSIFGSQKAISVDNPALWFYVEGMGGMHAAGVAWRNFGVTGVFFQCALAVFVLSKIERFVIKYRTFWVQFFYLVVASQLMHTVWYSLVSMVNAMVLFSMIYICFNFENLFRVLACRDIKKI